jgi:hypothetical protein
LCYENKEGKYKFLFTDLGQREFEMLFMEIHRHVAVTEFFKVLSDTIEDVRKDFMRVNELIVQAVEYIQIKNKQINNYGK